MKYIKKFTFFLIIFFNIYCGESPKNQIAIPPYSLYSHALPEEPFPFIKYPHYDYAMFIDQKPLSSTLMTLHKQIQPNFQASIEKKSGTQTHTTKIQCDITSFTHQLLKEIDPELKEQYYKRYEQEKLSYMQKYSKQVFFGGFSLGILTVLSTQWFCTYCQKTLFPSLFTKLELVLEKQ